MIWVVILIMIAAGFAGGAVNVALKGTHFDRKRWLLSVAAGLGASFLTPLFLRTMSSNILSNILNDSPKYEDFFVFSGFCLLAAITSKAFIQTLSDKLINEIQETRRQSIAMTEKVIEVEEVADQANTIAHIAHDVAEYNLGRSHRDEVKGPVEDAPSILKGTYQDDPWAGQFGDKSTFGTRCLEATISDMPGKLDWKSIRLLVRSTDPERDPLMDKVQFFIHPTFENYTPIVPVVNSVAEIRISSWGAFTVGALLDENRVKLELDLSEHPDATEPWKSL